ncbi:HNH endonuclease [uncultured Aeromicrobium sp.]|uniref:HNH endonuclease n=1 Tax=uncultured Aeromicrobium sp. TaxID=337820 RepID=UPI0025CFF173|nr:HNH endonuclease [uncultured Aeromicrobium sp.]
MGTTRAEQAVRDAMLEHHGPNPTCWRCHKPIKGTPDAGHIIDRMAGGTYTLDNLLPEHPHCNRSAGGRLGAMITNSRRKRRPSRKW